MNDGVEVVATIDRNKRNLTKRDVDQAEVTRRFQHVAGHLSGDTLVRAASTNIIKNLSVVIQDVKLIYAVLKKSPYSVKGKTVRGQLDEFETEYILLPRNILEYYKHMTICADALM